MKKVIYTLVIVLAMFSCSSDDDSSSSTQPSEETGVLLKREIITFDDGSTITYEYTYNGNKLIGYTSNDGESGTYTYENNLLVRIDEIYLDPMGEEDSEYTLLEYDDDNNLIQFSWNNDNGSDVFNLTYNSDGTIITENVVGTNEEYILTFENGNLINYFGSNTGTQHNSVYTYDDKNGINKNLFAANVFRIVDGLGTATTNNVLSETTTFIPVQPVNYDYTVTYTYNSDNYPITAREVNEDGTIYTTEYFYE